jgi:phytoene dehydrogenase-like protein
VDGGHEVALYEARPTLGGAVQTLPRREGDPSRRPTTASTSRSAASPRTSASSTASARRLVRRRRSSCRCSTSAGRSAAIAPSALALLRYRHVSLGERLGSCARSRAGATREGETFADALRARGQSQRRSTASGTSSSGRR